MVEEDLKEIRCVKTWAGSNWLKIESTDNKHHSFSTKGRRFLDQLKEFSCTRGDLPPQLCSRAEYEIC
jgi:hypothetical protein